MNAFFFHNINGLETLHGATGDLVAIGTGPAQRALPEGATAITGTDLPAIRHTLGIVPSERGHARGLKTPSRMIDSAAFIARIPVDVWKKVRAAAAQNAALDKALYQLSASPDVHDDNPQLLGMLAALVQGGVITEGERAQIVGF